MFRPRIVVPAALAASALLLAPAAQAGGGGLAPAVPAPTVQAQASQGLAPLYQAAADRLVLAKDVAAAKHVSGSPVEDLAQEKRVIDNAIAQGALLGLDATRVEAVMRDQIEASKMVQRSHMALWSAQPGLFPAQHPTLDETRVKITRATDALLGALAARPVGQCTLDDALNKLEAAAFVQLGLGYPTIDSRPAADRATASLCG